MAASLMGIRHLKNEYRRPLLCVPLSYTISPKGRQKKNLSIGSSGEVFLFFFHYNRSRKNA